MNNVSSIFASGYIDNHLIGNECYLYISSALVNKHYCDATVYYNSLFTLSLLAIYATLICDSHLQHCTLHVHHVQYRFHHYSITTCKNYHLEYTLSLGSHTYNDDCKTWHFSINVTHIIYHCTTRDYAEAICP